MKQIEWLNGTLRLLDQRKLPLSMEYIDCDDYMLVYDAIKTLAVRGAPLIGVSAAMGICVAARQAVKGGFDVQKYTADAEKKLRSARPTAVNLMWALDRMLPFIAAYSGDNDAYIASLDKEAFAIWEEDIELCRKMGEFGLDVVPQNANIITHCNTGSLATAGDGTALAVIRHAHRAGRNIHVYADETRPLLQGARLTAWELDQDGIPFTLMCDNMSSHLMKTHKIDLIVTGADRIAANGDSANKIGTYGLAVSAAYHKVPFYIAAPYSTIDMSIKSGDEIIIEQRNPEEVRSLGGVRTAPEGCDAFNPAFDVTPNSLIKGIITDRGIIRPPFDINLRKLLG
ncbi:MAG: S-methyl-5-thioribose-1-phosphate isomerase [bacterium]|nr:S-methyl-5-thioribose-1-phosphate isomerase [bacterium]